MVTYRDRILEARDWLAGNGGKPNYFIDPTTQRVSYLVPAANGWTNVSKPHPLATTFALAVPILDWRTITFDGPTGTGKTHIAVAGAYVNAARQYRTVQEFLESCYQRFSPNGRVEDIFIDRTNQAPKATLLIPNRAEDILNHGKGAQPRLKPSVNAPFLVADELSLLSPRELEDFLYAVDGGRLVRPDISLDLPNRPVIGTMNRGSGTYYEEYSPRARSRTSLSITIPALDGEQRKLMRALDLDPNPLNNLGKIPDEYLLTQEDLEEGKSRIADVRIHPYAADFADYAVDAMNACIMSEMPGYKESGHFAIGPRCGPCPYSARSFWTPQKVTVAGQTKDISVPLYCQLTENTLDNRTARQIENIGRLFAYLDGIEEVGPETMASVIGIIGPTKLVPTRTHLANQQTYNGNKQLMIQQLSDSILTRYYRLRGFDAGTFDPAEDIFAARERVLTGDYNNAGGPTLEHDVALIKSWVPRDPYVQTHFGSVAALLDDQQRIEAYRTIVSRDPAIGEQRGQLASMREELVQLPGNEALVKAIDRRLAKVI